MKNSKKSLRKKDWLDYHKKYSKAKEEMEELLRTVQSGRLKDYMEELWKVPDIDL